MRFHSIFYTIQTVLVTMDAWECVCFFFLVSKLQHLALARFCMRKNKQIKKQHQQ